MTPTITLDPPAWGSLARVGPRLWRVQERRGRIVGHVRLVPDDGGDPRYRAERFHAATGAFRLLGEFRSPGEAIATLRG